MRERTVIGVKQTKKEKEKKEKEKKEKKKKKEKKEKEQEKKDDEVIKKEKSPPIETLLRVFKRRRERRSGDVCNPKKKPIIPPYTHDHILRVPEGIVSFIHFEFPSMIGRHSRHLVLLGDVHTDKVIMDEAGQYVLDWIVGTLVKNPNQCVDLFLEISPDMYNPRPYEKAGQLFGETFKHINLIKKFKNIRVHHVDTRMGIDSLPKYTYENSTLLQDTLKYIKEKKEPRLTIATFISMCIAVIMYFVFHLEYVHLINDETVVLLHKLGLEDKVNNEFFGDVGYIILWKLSKKIEKQISKSIFATNKIKFFKCLYDATTHCLNINTPSLTNHVYTMTFFMDAYCLARLFREFPDKGRFRGPCTKYMQYPVVYTGSFHTAVYRKFIEIYFGLEEKVHESNYRDKRPKIEPFQLIKQ